MIKTPCLLVATLATLASTGASQCSWHQHSFLTPPGGYGSEPQYFARSLSLVGDGLVVGSPGLDGSLGVAHVFEHTDDGWLHAGAVSATGSASGDDFGRAVALDADVIAVGAPLASGGDGRVIVFERAVGTWHEVASLGLPGAPGGNLGAALSLSGDTLLAGAPGAGTVAVFERDALGWSLATTLAPEEAAEDFGRSLDSDGARAVVGAPDEEEAFVFLQTPAGWVEEQRLEPQDEVHEARFGTSVAIDGDAIAVGAEGELEDDEPPGTGAAWVFRLDEEWEEEAAIAAPSGQAGVRFGASVALDGDTLAVGSPGDQGGLGRVFTYLGAGGDWFASSTLAPYLEGAQGQFGSAVALDGPMLLANVGLDETGLIGAVGPYAGAAQAWIAPGIGCAQMLADVTRISASSGGTQTLLLDPNGEQTAPLYLLAGSASGTSPGVSVGTVTLPLNADTYLAWSIASANQGPFADTFGSFAQADADVPTVARVTLPAGLGVSFAGTTLHHAFAALDPGGGALVVGTSNAVPLTIEP